MYIGNFKHIGIFTMVVLMLADTCVLSVQCARILAIQPKMAKSHWNFMSAVLHSLLDGGHNVTVFTPFPDGNRENYTEVDTSKEFPIEVGTSLLKWKEMFKSIYVFVNEMFKYERHICEILYKNHRLKDMLSEGLDANFDAILIEPCFSSCLLYPAAKTKLPLIFMVPMAFTYNERLSLMLGDVPNTASVSDITADHAVPTTFAQRFTNTVLKLSMTSFSYFQELFLKTFDPKPFDVHTPVSPSIVFLNGHFVSDASRPIPPNVISIGGIHLKPVKKITSHILQFIENSPHGVILFSLGSNTKMSTIPENIQKSIVNAFAKLPQRVLLKYEGEIKNKPENIMTVEWFPQRDVLMHSNVKLFISHGGISGLYETVDAGVPVLGFPLFGDQYRNIQHLVRAGMAISMEILSMSEDSFLKNVKELINDERYSKNAKITSKIFRDRPVTPEKLVLYWTEYVIRHKGATHLKSNSINLSWYQYILLDVISAMVLLILMVLYTIYKTYKIVSKFVTTFLSNMKSKSE